MGKEHIFEGHAFLGEALDLTPASIVVKDGIITGIEELSHAPSRWICPAFFNAHTHVGDTIALDLPSSGSLEELVTPPHGLKHRILQSAPRNALVRGMRTALLTMIRTGTGGCADFREGGVPGVRMLREAAADLPWMPIIFGREGGEGISDGLGISSVRDVRDAEQQATEARKKGKRIALHAGERDAVDLEGALALEPDLIVHATHATDAQLRRCADAGIPIAICPRSNWTLGVTSSSAHPPFRRMIETGCTILLGTDNVMFVQPDMFQEMAFVETIYRLPSHLILRAAIEGARWSGTSWYLTKGAPARFFCVNALSGLLPFSRDPCTTFIKRVNGGEILENVLTAGYE